MHRKLVAAIATFLAGKVAGVDVLVSIWQDIAPVLRESGVSLGYLSSINATDLFVAAAFVAFAYTKDEKRDQAKPIDAEALARAVKDALESEREWQREIILTNPVPGYRAKDWHEWNTGSRRTPESGD